MSTLIFRYNPKENSVYSDCTKMYSRNIKSRLYGTLRKNQSIKIFGSGKLSGLYLYDGVLTSTPLLEDEPDELFRLTNRRKWKRKIWKFEIKITNTININIIDTYIWSIIKKVIYPRIIYI